MKRDPPVVGIVGPCAAGKSTLAQALNDHGVPARQIVQEHSYVPDMWKVVSQPAFLVYLDASYETCSRRKALMWSRSEYEEQLSRLSHARQHCDVLVHTDELPLSLVFDRVLDSVREHGLMSSGSLTD